MSDKKVKITLIKSVIGSRPNQRKTVEALGLRKINSSVVKTVTPPIRGMINTIAHLVEVEDVQ